MFTLFLVEIKTLFKGKYNIIIQLDNHFIIVGRY